MKLSQKAYIERLVEQFDMVSAGSVLTQMTPDFPAESNMQQDITDKEKYEMNNKPYRELIVSLLYLARRTRPDISYAMSVLCRASQNLSVLHWNAAKRVLRYLSETKDYGLMVGRTGVKGQGYEGDELIAYSDVDLAGDRSDRLSTTGFVIFLNARILSWGSRKQKCVGLSSTLYSADLRRAR